MAYSTAAYAATTRDPRPTHDCTQLEATTEVHIAETVTQVYIAATPKCLVRMWAQTPKPVTRSSNCRLLTCQLCHLSPLSFLALQNLRPAPCNFICKQHRRFYEQSGTVHSLAHQLAHAQRTKLRVNVTQLGSNSSANTRSVQKANADPVRNTQACNIAMQV